MKYTKIMTAVEFYYPFYIAAPDDMDADEVAELVEDAPDGPNGWAFAEDDVKSIVGSRVPHAENLCVNISETIGTYDHPDSPAVYDLAELTSPETVANVAVEKAIERLFDKAYDAVNGREPKALYDLAKEIMSLASDKE